MKKSLLMLTMACSAMFAPSMASATAVEEIAGKFASVGDAVTKISDGWYALYNVGRSAYVSEETSGWYMRTTLPTDLSSEACAGYVFKVTTVDNGYTIMSGNGSYFNIAQSACSTTDSPVTYTVDSHLEGKFYMVNQSNNIVVDGNAAGGTFVGWGSSVPTSSGNSTYEFRSVSFLEENQVLDIQKNAVIDLIYKLQSFYGLVQNASNYYCNKKESSEGTYEALLDGDYSTYFHSAYQGDGWNSETHYLQASIGSAAGDFRFFTKKRSQNDNNRPNNITVKGATSAEGEYSDITTISSGLPTDAAELVYLSDKISAGENTHLRFVVNSTNTGTMFFTYSEFYILPANENVEKAAEIYNKLNTLSASDVEEIASQAEAISELDADVQAEIDSQTANITFNFPVFGDNQLSIAVNEVKLGTDASSIIPSVAFFSDAAISNDDKTVSASNNTFTVTGTWTFPFTDDQVYRIDIRQSDTSLGCTKLYYDVTTSKVSTRNGTDADAFEPARLFYFDAKGFDENANLKVTLHSIAADASKGLYAVPDNNSHGVFSETPTEFLVVTNDNGTDGVSLQHPDNTNSHVNDVNGTLGIWQDGNSRNDNGSFLRFFALSDDDFSGLLSGDNAALFSEEKVNAAKESKTSADVRAAFADYAEYAAAVAEANALISSISGYSADSFRDALGYFSGTTYDAIATLVSALQSAVAGTDVEAIKAATDALEAELAKVTFNKPQAGKFYRIKCVNNNEYLNGTVISDRIPMLEDSEDNKAESVFYYDGTYLVAWQDGKVLGKFLSGDNSNSWKTVLSTNEKAGEIIFGAATTLGQFTIQPSSGRYIYGANDNVDCGGSAANDGYYWIITEVQWLPIVGSDKELTAVYCPVSLNLKDNVSAYTATISGVTVPTTKIEEGGIPANTAVLVKFADEVERDASTGLVYLELNYNAVSLAAEEEAVATPLSGSFYAVAAEDGKSYYTAQERTHTYTDEAGSEQSETVVDFCAYNEAEIPGFVTYIAVATEDAPAAGYYAITGEGSTTGIEEIVAPDSNVRSGIYDLQGRKLSAPVKGINIINGKKVLVK